MTTSAMSMAGVAASESLAPTQRVVTETPPRPSTVYIVGFAPSWNETPWGRPDSHYWGMNALHKLAPPEIRWNAWFQLHDIVEHHRDDAEEHIAWLAAQPMPIFMWAEHIGK